MNRLGYTALFCLLVCTSFLAVANETPPKLVVQITIDGLRADLIQRYQHHFSDAGFRYFMNQGAYFTNANYEHANTETIVGHVSLATGAPPSVHGMVGNVWFDRKLDRLIYNVEDANYHILTPGAGVNKKTEIDTTQKAAKSDGRSPLPILSSTFSDELSLATHGKAKIFSVSVKDRGAISLAGDNGKAFWFSKSKKQFITSSYYYKQYPNWVNQWNQSNKAAQYSNKQWALTLAEKEYDSIDNSSEHLVDLAGFGKTFPHAYGSDSGKYFGTLLTLSPAGDELTLNFAKTLMKAEQLGSDNITDYFAISFSSTDYVSHLFGPSTTEQEDNLIRLDRTLASLLKLIDEQVGLQHTLIALSADHGIAEATPVSRHIGNHDAHYFDEKSFVNPALVSRLKQEFDTDEKVIRLYSKPYIYLNEHLIKKRGLSIEKVEQVIAEEMLKVKGIRAAITRSQIESNALIQSNVTKAVRQNYNPQRSGNIHIIFSPRNYINDMDGLTIAATHGSPWRYDTHVPIIFAGYKVKPNRVSRYITPYDIAPTLSSILGINFPSGATGTPLKELTFH